MSFYNTCRAQKKEIYTLGKEARQRAERKRLLRLYEKGDTLQELRLHGRRCVVHQDSEIYTAQESGQQLRPWKERHNDNQIDRFDGRSHLDVIPQYIPRKDGGGSGSSETHSSSDSEQQLQVPSSHLIPCFSFFLSLCMYIYIYILYLPLTSPQTGSSPQRILINSLLYLHLYAS